MSFEKEKTKKSNDSFYKMLFLIKNITFFINFYKKEYGYPFLFAIFLVFLFFITVMYLTNNLIIYTIYLLGLILFINYFFKPLSKEKKEILEKKYQDFLQTYQEEKE